MGGNIETINMTLSPYAAPGIPKREISLSYIEEVVSEHFNTDIREVHSKSKKEHLVLCRHLISLLARELLNLTYAELGAFFNTDHSTALKSVRKAKDLIDTDLEFADAVKEIKAKIRLGF